jgi:hypothetical protein
MDTFILGVIVIYSIAHLFALQTKAYKDRSLYEKIVSWVGFVSIILLILGPIING